MESRNDPDEKPCVPGEPAVGPKGKDPAIPLQLWGVSDSSMGKRSCERDRGIGDRPSGHSFLPPIEDVDKGVDVMETILFAGVTALLGMLSSCAST